jgi:uncharacterized protein (DUF488 family)
MERLPRSSPRSSSPPQASTRAQSERLGARQGSVGASLCTIGYEGIDIERFLTLLRSHAVETVVDVRELPLSRKSGFSKKALQGHLAHAGIQYIHVPELGCPRQIRHQYRADRDWARYEVAFLAHLQMQEVALTALGASVCDTQCALMCFEADATFCHRRMVAAALAPRTQLPIIHIS